MQPGELGTNTFHRKWASLSLNQDVTLIPYDPFSLGVPIAAYSLTFEVRYCLGKAVQNGRLMYCITRLILLGKDNKLLKF
jgi:vesicle-fusing ATPase